jgi:hypothetical protein
VAVHSPGAVVVDGAGQSATLIAPLQKAGVTVTRTGPGQMAAAAGGLHDAVLERRLAHMDQAVLNAAVEGAAQRTLGDAWAWSRRSSRSNVTPLVAASLAHWAVAGGNMAQLVELLAWI